MAKNRPPAPVPLTRERVLEAIRKIGGKAQKRDIAHELGIGSDQKKELRHILRELEDEGALGRSGRKSYADANALPESGVMDVLDRDPDGELLVRMRGPEGYFGPVIRLAPGEARRMKGEAAIGIGDRVLARIHRDDDGQFEARVVKRLGQSAHRILGVYRASKDPRARFGGGRVEPADRKARHDIVIEPQHVGETKDGDLVFVELAPERGRAHGPKHGIIKETIGRESDPRAASILAMHTHGIREGFSPDEEAQANAAQKPTLKGRTDLRDIPLITIDPEDARDHDDAVYAAPDTDEKNKGGWRVWVAIADVSAYVTPGSPLDRGAWRRGNSTYFPDRVAPMLPESLSADLCSLREHEERACLAVEMIFDREGHKLRHKFVRGLMRSAAKLSYEHAQAAIDGKPNDKTGPLLEPVLKPLWEAYRTVWKAREKRQPLEIDAPEHKIIFKDGKVAGVKRRERFDAHKLIEEFMIQANVCAAETLEQKNRPQIYRVHDRPSDTKIAALTDFLPTVDMAWAKGQNVTAARFNRVLHLAEQSPNKDIINEVILRTQSQAVYTPDNIGHFGLNLRAYSHFTSPIRRYSDVTIHRALIRALKLGEDGASDAEEQRYEETAQHISETERQSMAAERDATARYISAFLSDRIGADFEGRVTGVTRFGLFIRLDETQADGLAPISTLGHERWFHDETAHALVGEQTGQRYQLGMRVEVRLEEATPISGGLVFQMLTDALPSVPGWRKSRPSGQSQRGGGGGKRERDGKRRKRRK
ncbi:ribonuclease R [Candidatus Viadribacter manganicus]|uniref:Ribonuclease R n=1 Tax=Candidatus Viadribacter manganicus TaxID=1759059 RepID=A0A1B1AM62_9PROT|nr:ribonuclease R [Candidatus Viadribacter manganicus]ANP47631.1 ribonuclease R [Candidatus Viadribacter manganicus]